MPGSAGRRGVRSSSVRAAPLTRRPTRPLTGPLTRWLTRPLPRPLATALALGLLTSACAPVDERQEAAEREAELAIRSLLSAFESADTDLVADLFWPQASYDDFPNQHTYQGIDEIVGYVTAVHRWADDVYMNVGVVHASADGAVAEWVFSGTQNRPLGDQVPVATGNDVVLNGVTIIELRDGRIIRAADYTDTGALMLQLGGRIELPGGGVVELDGR